MVQWGNIIGVNHDRHSHRFRDEARRLLPIFAREEGLESAYPATEVTKIALKLKYQIEQIIPCELEEWKITKANSPIITQKVAKTAKEAGGEKYPSCVIFCLLICKRWFKLQANLELWDAEMHQGRAVACEVLAKRLIETEEDEDFLMQETLLKRYSVILNGRETVPANVIERAVDLHALLVIGSSGYQKCISYLWRGWLIQDDTNASSFIPYKKKANTDYWSHFDPDRMRVPKYQNMVQIFFSVLYLALYTGAINTINSTGDLDIVEGVLYVMTAGFIFDEIAKFWKDKFHNHSMGNRQSNNRSLGRYYIGFWNVFNSTLYALLTVSFVTRCIAISSAVHDPRKAKFNELSYNFLAFSAPMFWLRLLLYLDSFRFFGSMLVVLKVMMTESLIFFALLIVICAGFFQAFMGMDEIHDRNTVAKFIVQAMVNSVVQAPDFSGFEDFSPPFGIILYYIYSFVIMVILLNILIALYNSAYSDITDNSIDEYMALVAEKTMQFVRAPDENVFIAPFNLIELCCLILPFEWWMEKNKYERLNNYVMGLLYSPLLLITAYMETKEAHQVELARRRGDADDDSIEEWEQLGAEGETLDYEGDGWAKTVEATKPNVETDATVLEIRALKGKLEELKKMIAALDRGGSAE